MKPRTFFWSVFALIALFALFVWVNEKLAYHRAVRATERYAKFLAPPLWNIDTPSGQEYADLIADAGGYQRIAVYHPDGELFVRGARPADEELSRFENLLTRWGLLRQVPFQVRVNYHGKEIGRIDATWINRSIFIYLYTGLLLLLVVSVMLLANFFRAVARQRERVEEALTESRERLKTVVAGAPIILFAVNREGIFTLSEGKGLAKIGREQGELVGCSIPEVYSEARAAKQDIERAFRGETFTAVREIDGKSFETWYSPLTGQGDQIDRVIGVATDVTDFQRAIRELELRDDNMRQELSLARKIQRAMLPDALPLVDGLEVGMVFVPSGDIGGDFVNFIQSRDKHRLGIVFADITGHGVPAALLSAMFKVVIDDVLQTTEGPGQVFQTLNRRLSREFPRGNFASAFYCVFDMRKKLLVYVKASQEPALLFGPGRGIVKLKAGGPVLGILDPELCEEARYDEQRIELQSGDTLFLYTDGLVEIEDRDGQMLDRETLCIWVQEALDLPPQALVDKIHRRALDFAGTPELPDDIAILAVRVKGRPR